MADELTTLFQAAQDAESQSDTPGAEESPQDLIAAIFDTSTLDADGDKGKRKSGTDQAGSGDGESGQDGNAADKTRTQAETVSVKFGAKEFKVPKGFEQTAQEILDQAYRPLEREFHARNNKGGSGAIDESAGNAKPDEKEIAAKREAALARRDESFGKILHEAFKAFDEQKPGSAAGLTAALLELIDLRTSADVEDVQQTLKALQAENEALRQEIFGTLGDDMNLRKVKAQLGRDLERWGEKPGALQAEDVLAEIKRLLAADPKLDHRDAYHDAVQIVSRRKPGKGSAQPPPAAGNGNLLNLERPAAPNRVAPQGGDGQPPPPRRFSLSDDESPETVLYRK